MKAPVNELAEGSTSRLSGTLTVSVGTRPYVRKTEDYLLMAEFAFLDETRLSSPAILSALLTLINERLFRNGDRTEEAPLEALVAESNETPDVN